MQNRNPGNREGRTLCKVPNGPLGPNRVLNKVGMSHYHFHMDPIRRHRGGNALERAAYQARECLSCPVTNEVYDHTDKDDLVQAVLVGTDLPREQVWLLVELAEIRYTAVVARSYKVALPHENSDATNWTLLLQMGRHMSRTLNTVVDVAFHKRRKKGRRNDHGHFLVPPREWNEESAQFGAKTRAMDVRWQGAKVIREFRETWEAIVNASLPEWASKVSCKSHATKVDGLIPKKHLGRVATEMKRRGQWTFRGEYNDTVDALHRELEAVRKIELELSSLGLGVTPEAVEVARPSEPNDTACQAPVPLVELPAHAIAAEPATEPAPNDWLLAPNSVNDDLAEAFAAMPSLPPLMPGPATTAHSGTHPHHAAVAPREPDSDDCTTVEVAASTPSVPDPEPPVPLDEADQPYEVEPCDWSLAPNSMEEDLAEASANARPSPLLLTSTTSLPATADTFVPGMTPTELCPGALEDELRQALEHIEEPLHGPPAQ